MKNSSTSNTVSLSDITNDGILNLYDRNTIGGLSTSGTGNTDGTNNIANLSGSLTKQNLQ